MINPAERTEERRTRERIASENIGRVTRLTFHNLKFNPRWFDFVRLVSSDEGMMDLISRNESGETRDPRRAGFDWLELEYNLARWLCDLAYGIPRDRVMDITAEALYVKIIYDHSLPDYDPAQFFPGDIHAVLHRLGHSAMKEIFPDRTHAFRESFDKKYRN